MTYKANIATDARFIYVLENGDDNEAGTSLETAKGTIQGAIDAVNALSPPPDALNRAVISIEGSGDFGENIVLPNFTSVDALRSTNAVSSGTTYTLGSFAGYTFGTTANSGTSGTVFAAANQTSLSLECSEINITGDGTTALAVSGTTDDSFFRITQLRLNGDGAIGVNYTASNGEPEVFIFASITLEDDNTIAFIHDPSVSTARSIFDVAGIGEIGSPTDTTGIRVIDGHVSAYVNEIIAGDALDIQGGELSIMSNCITGDITIAVGATLVCEIAEFTGTLTNNGTISGRIGDQYFTTGVVTTSDTLTNNTLIVGNGGVDVDNRENATITDDGTDLNLSLTNPDSSGDTSIRLLNSSASLKTSLGYNETNDRFNIVSATTGGFSFTEIFGDMDFAFNSATGTINLLGVGSADTNSIINIASESGANAASIEIFAGTRNPEGNIAADPGNVYLRANGTSSGIFQLKAASAGNAGWIESGDVFGASTAPLQSFVIAGDTSGKSISFLSQMTFSESAGQLDVRFDPPAANGIIQLALRDTSAVKHVLLEYDEQNNIGGLFVNNDSGAEQFRLVFDNSANEIQLTGNDDLVFSTTGEFDVIASDPVRIDSTADEVEIRANTNIDIIAETGTFTNLVEGIGGFILLSASSNTDAQQVVRINAGGANGALIDFHTGGRIPEGNVSADGGHFYLRNNRFDSNFYIKKTATSTTADWHGVITTTASSSTANGLAYYVGADGYELAASAQALLVESANDIELGLIPVTASGQSVVQFLNNASAQRMDVGYNQSTDVASIQTFLSTTELLISSEEQPVEIAIQVADTNPIVKLSNSQNDFDIYSRTADPQGAVSGTNGDIVVVGNDINSTAIHLQRESSSSTSWGQVELLQKQFETVDSNTTLSRNFQRILLINTVDIDLTIPTPSAISKNQGFEQTLTKNITNTNIITVDIPGFYGHTGNFVISKRGDSVTYMQTASANVILNTNRNVVGILQRTGGTYLTINGDTGVDIILNGWNTDTESYEGLCTANEANDRFVFNDVENLTDGDLYELELIVVGYWSNNSDINYHADVDDSGITTQYNIFMEQTAVGGMDETTLFGKTQIRTGTNDAGGLDTSVQIGFTLPTGDDLNFRQGWWKLTKIEGR